jgi:transcription factor SOX7/8/10/18 (SOX group E/F)
MSTQTYLTLAPASELSRSNAHEAAMAQFDLALAACVRGWNCGDDITVLQDNIQELFGNVLFEYFKRALLELVGESATLTIMSSGDGAHTLVRMSKNKMTETPSQEQLNAKSALPEPSKHTTVGNDAIAVAAGLKKAPRPMNCWIIYRDAKHKQLKAEFPHLTVQEICKYRTFTLIFAFVLTVS